MKLTSLEFPILLVVALCLATTVDAAVTSTFDRGTANDGSDLPYQPLDDDLIAGIAPPTVIGARGTLDGFRDAAPVPDPPDRFPAYTDGAFGGGLHGLLVDNEPVIDGGILQDIEYDLRGAKVSEVRVFGGNADARQFLTLELQLSFDGVNYVGVGPDGGYFQPAGINSNDEPSGFGSVMRIYDDSGAPLGTGVEKVRLVFYASGNNNPQRYVDPFNGVNPFTSFDDGQGAANQAPLIREVDIVPEPAAGLLVSLAALAGLAAARRKR